MAFDVQEVGTTSPGGSLLVHMQFMALVLQNSREGKKDVGPIFVAHEMAMQDPQNPFDITNHLINAFTC